jgi:hypothetical protein
MDCAKRSTIPTTPYSASAFKTEVQAAINAASAFDCSALCGSQKTAEAAPAARKRSHRRRRLSLLLNELRLPAIKALWPQFSETSDKDGWPAARFPSAIAEHERAQRGPRRIERHLAEGKRLPGKTLETANTQRKYGLAGAIPKYINHLSPSDPA